MRIEPAVAGTYHWLGERRLIFQPDAPGFERGVTYTVRVAEDAAGVSSAVEHSFEVEGGLRVEQVIPSDGDEEVPVEAQILVQFSRAMAPLTVLAALKEDDVVEFSPPIAGTGEWLNTALYRFRPQQLDPATEYTARIGAGLTSVTDEQLPADFVWTFTTIAPAVTAIAPDDNSRFAPRASEITVTFNQSMDRASVERDFRLLGFGTPVDGTFRWSEGDSVVTFHPAQPLELSTPYTVLVPPGVRGAPSGETREQRTVVFRTSDPPRVESTSPHNGDRNASRYGVSVVYNNPLDLDSFDGLVSISGIAEEDIRLRLHTRDRILSVSASLEPETDYAVTIASGATDREGLPLGPHSFSFRTGALTPDARFAIPSSSATFSASSEPILNVQTTNLGSMRFELYQLTDNEADRYILNGFPRRSGSRAWRPSRPPLRSWTLDIEGPRNVVNITPTSLSGDGKPLRKGSYWLVGSGGSNREPAMLFRVVDAALVAKLSNEKLLVWLLDYDSGEPLANVDLTVRSRWSGPWSATTDDEGLATIDVPDALEWSTRYSRSFLVTLEDGGRLGVTHTDWSNGSNRWELGVPIEGQCEFVGHVYTDRPIYRPGETVFYKGNVRRDYDAHYELPDEDARFFVEIYDPRYESIVKKLGEEAPTGSYTIRLFGEGLRERHITSATFRVAEFRKPEFEVRTEVPRANYVDGETIAATAIATFFFGGAVEDAPVEWRALAAPAHVRFEGYERYSFTDRDFFPPRRGQRAAAGRG